MEAVVSSPLPLQLSRILHPTTLQQPSEAALAHALRLALQTRADLELVQLTGRRDPAPCADWPPLRPMLERWGELPSGSSPADAERLGVAIHRTVIRSDDPLRAIGGHFRLRPADLIVLTVEHRAELFPGFREGFSIPLVWDCRIPALLIPDSGRGFVSAESGGTRLERVLIGVARHPDAAAALHGAACFAALFARRNLRLTALHVGEDPPQLAWRLMEGWTAELRQTNGKAPDRILEQAQELRADLIVLATRGPKGLWEALFGSTAERVVRQAPCPVLVVPKVADPSDPTPVLADDPQAAPAL